MTRQAPEELRDHSFTLDQIAISFRALADVMEGGNGDAFHADSLEEISRCINMLQRARSQIEKAIREGF
jgi:hypothetical protein